MAKMVTEWDSKGRGGLNNQKTIQKSQDRTGIDYARKILAQKKEQDKGVHDDAINRDSTVRETDVAKRNREDIEQVIRDNKPRDGRDQKNNDLNRNVDNQKQNKERIKIGIENSNNAANEVRRSSKKLGVKVSSKAVKAAKNTAKDNTVDKSKNIKRDAKKIKDVRKKSSKSNKKISINKKEKDAISKILGKDIARETKKNEKSHNMTAERIKQLSGRSGDKKPKAPVRQTSLNRDRVIQKGRGGRGD